MSVKPTRLKLVGMDPSLRHWGLAVAWYDLDTRDLTVEQLSIAKPVVPKGKQVRQNSSDIESAVQLYQGAVAVVQGAHAVFVEVPIGSQSARAMASYGICVGVLGSLRATGVPFFEMTPRETKLAGAGKATATKQEMISWAVARHPEANWPTYKRGGKELVSASEAEHMADAVAAIHAGLASNQFQQLMSLVTSQIPEFKFANPAETA